MSLSSQSACKTQPVTHQPAAAGLSLLPDYQLLSAQQSWHPSTLGFEVLLVPCWSTRSVSPVSLQR